MIGYGTEQQLNISIRSMRTPSLAAEAQCRSDETEFMGITHGQSKCYDHVLTQLCKLKRGEVLKWMITL